MATFSKLALTPDTVTMLSPKERMVPSARILALVPALMVTALEMVSWEVSTMSAPSSSSTVPPFAMAERSSSSLLMRPGSSGSSSVTFTVKEAVWQTTSSPSFSLMSTTIS